MHYLKDNRETTKYELAGESWGAINKAIAWVEENGKEEVLKQEVIDLWEEIQAAFTTERRPKWGV